MCSWSAFCSADNSSPYNELVPIRTRQGPIYFKNRDHLGTMENQIETTFEILKTNRYKFLSRVQISKFILWTKQKASTDNEAIQTTYFMFELPFWQNRDQFSKIETKQGPKMVKWSLQGLCLKIGTDLSALLLDNLSAFWIIGPPFG